MNKLRPIYLSGAVTRFHTMRTLHRQTVAEHAWGVAAVLLWLHAPHLPSAALLRAALLHDLPEVVTGDVPAPAKWDNAALSAALDMAEQAFHEAHGTADVMSALTLEEHDLLKFADMAELVLYTLAEAALGNRAALVVARRGIAHLGRTGRTFLSLRTTELIVSLEEQVNELERR